MRVFIAGRKRNSRIGKTPLEELNDYRACMDLLCTCKTKEEAVEKATDLGILTSWKTPLSWQSFLRYCHYILLYEPDKWREKVSLVEGPMSDDEWDQHVMETAVRYAVYNKQVVYRLILSDPKRWGKFSRMWDGLPDFEKLKLPA